MKVVDLRSDTVTLPTEEMLEAIRHAELGDDVYREDPTVNRLEELAAKKMGKDGAMLVSSGTQANLVSLMANTKRGEEVILESESHMYTREVGGMSALGGVLARPLEGKFGVLDPKEVEKALRPKNIHCPETTLICIENTHNRAGGTIVSPSQTKAIGDVAKAHNIRLYMDGARLFNAAVALQVDAREFTKHVDSLMFCLSKGLSAPVGSIVVGSSDFIQKARKMRKMLGGGMRQAGIIAASGIIALENMIGRLREDHNNAKILAVGLDKLDGVSVNLDIVQTNIVHFDISRLGTDSSQFVNRLQKHGIKALTRDKTAVRMVTHRGIEREDIEYTLNAVESVLKGIT